MAKASSTPKTTAKKSRTTKARQQEDLPLGLTSKEAVPAVPAPRKKRKTAQISPEETPEEAH